jgi:hypothetical protein
MKRLLYCLPTCALLALLACTSPAQASVTSPGPGGGEQEENHDSLHDEDHDHDRDNDHERGHHYTNRDLKGTFVCNAQEIFQTASGLDFCVYSLILEADGAGNATISSGTQRCSLSGSGPFAPLPATYVVYPDGSFLLSDQPNMANPRHGQIVEHGQSLLFDATTRTAPVVSGSSVCMRR